MKVKIVVTDELGNVFGGEATLNPISNPVGAETDPRELALPAINFGLGERAYAKTYAGGRSGPEVFTLLVAYLSKGDCSRGIAVKEVQTLWGRMTSVLGMAFNAKYPTVAKEYGWINAPTRGIYVITGEWSKSYEVSPVA